MENKFDISLYDDEFFAWHAEHVHIPMFETGKDYFQYYSPNSFVDFGCGIGSYLLAAQIMGVARIQGYEIGGDHAVKYTDPRVTDFIDFNTDITISLDVEKYDHSFCIEVAEHIEPSGSEQLIKNITDATENMAVFTAAPKEQDGCGHINTHSKIYWINLFEKYGMKYSEWGVTKLKLLWETAPDYVLKNLMVFTR